MTLEQQLLEHVAKNEKDHDVLTEVHSLVQQILEQTKKTNGRVTHCEEDVKGLTNWKFTIVGGMSLFTLVILPALWIIFTQVKNNTFAITKNATVIERFLDK